ncbi:MAG: Two component transcriptional regulator, winged helix family protein [Clostridiales bacterium 38_11]|nr:MAG: Two component transcriptional regulator, winged helix family protein [Clostridiales bacterium 38_11]HBH12686.1 DNA-binding response regulator [Clostridiales bacterium]
MENNVILIADDDKEIVKLIVDTLEDEGFKVIKAYNGTGVIEVIQKKEQVDLVLLDIMMPGMDGIEVCKKIRDTYSGPIVFLSAKGREIDKVIGLELGADDYLTKPFSTIELVSRVKAHIRRDRRLKNLSSNTPVLSFDGLKICLDSFEVWKDGKKIDLTTREFQILAYMASNQNIVLSREKIYQSIWGNTDYGEINTVTVHIKYLRDKLDPDGKYIKTIWGVGYKFVGRAEVE